MEEHERGSVNSMQTSCYQLFYVVIQLMGMIFHRPQQVLLCSYAHVCAHFCLLAFAWEISRGHKHDIVLHWTRLY